MSKSWNFANLIALLASMLAALGARVRVQQHSFAPHSKSRVLQCENCYYPEPNAVLLYNEGPATGMCLYRKWKTGLETAKAPITAFNELHGKIQKDGWSTAWNNIWYFCNWMCVPPETPEGHRSKLTLGFKELKCVDMKLDEDLLAEVEEESTDLADAALYQPFASVDLESSLHTLESSVLAFKDPERVLSFSDDGYESDEEEPPPMVQRSDSGENSNSSGSESESGSDRSWVQDPAPPRRNELEEEEAEPQPIAPKPVLPDEPLPIIGAGVVVVETDEPEGAPKQVWVVQRKLPEGWLVHHAGGKEQKVVQNVKALPASDPTVKDIHALNKKVLGTCVTSCAEHAFHTDQRDGCCWRYAGLLEQDFGVWVSAHCVKVCSHHRG